MLSIYLHAGTHVDAPWHHMNNGKGIDAVPIEDFIYKKPLLIDCPLGPNGFITIDNLRQYKDLHEADILIFNRYFVHHAFMDHEKYGEPTMLIYEDINPAPLIGKKLLSAFAAPLRIKNHDASIVNIIVEIEE